MNICVISPRYPYKDAMESVFVEQIVNQWVRMGHHCFVIAPFSIMTYMHGHCAYGISYENRTIEGNKKVEIYKPRISGIPWTVSGVKISSYEAQRAICKVVKKLNVKFDFVYCHFFIQGVRAFNFACQYKLPLFVATGESTIPAIDKPGKGFQWDLFRKYVKGVICVSQKNKKEAISLGYTEESKCNVIPNAVDNSLFVKMDKKSIRVKMGFSDKDFVVVCVGEFSERKGQKRIIEAIKMLPENHRVKLILIGKGGERYQDGHIVFQGEVKHEKLPTYLNSGDVFVLPTLREGCCNAIIEAMACGLPIVSSDKDFNYDILNHSIAQLVDPMDVNAISSSIALYMNDEQRRQSDADRCYQVSQEYTLEKRANKILEFINSKLHAVT